MNRLGLSRKRIAALVRVPPAAVGYHLVIARRQDPGLEAEHRAAAGTVPVPYLSARDLARMGKVIAWVLAECPLPDGRSADRSAGRWRDGCPGAGAKRPQGPWTRPTAKGSPGRPGGPKTTGR